MRLEKFAPVVVAIAALTACSKQEATNYIPQQRKTSASQPHPAGRETVIIARTAENTTTITSEKQISSETNASDHSSSDPSSAAPENEMIQFCRENGVNTLPKNALYSEADCISLADSIFATISNHPDYRIISEMVGDRTSMIATFQKQNGLIVTQSIDAATFQTLDDERKRLERPKYEYDRHLSTEQIAKETASWTRQETVDRLAQMQAFRAQYLDTYSTRQDLLDPNKTTDTLLRRLNELIYFTGMNKIEFDILIVNSGHTTTTLSGNTSQHTLGEAIDIGLRNNGKSLPHSVPDPNIPTRRTELLGPTANYDAYTDAVTLLHDFFTPRRGEFSQVIASTLPYNLNHGQKVNPSIFGSEIVNTHQEHIHFAINN